MIDEIIRAEVHLPPIPQVVKDNIVILCLTTLLPAVFDFWLPAQGTDIRKISDPTLTRVRGPGGGDLVI